MEHNGIWDPRRYSDRHPLSIKNMTHLKQEFSEMQTEKTGIRPIYSSGAVRHVLEFPFLAIEKYYVHVDHSYQHPQAP